MHGNVIPFTSPEYEIPKIWRLNKVSSAMLDNDGEYSPDNMMETGTQLYMTYCHNDSVTNTLAESQIHTRQGI